MGGIIGGCIGSMFAGMCCCACKECSVVKHGPISRLPYIFLFFVAGLFALVMSLYGEDELDLKFTSVSACNSSSCKGNGSVYRVSFCLFIFELLHVIIIGGGVIAFHWMFFALKFLVFCVAVFICFIVDDSNDFFDGYSDYFARYLSAFYILLQILILITWGYEANETMQRKAIENSMSEDDDGDGSHKRCNYWMWLLPVSSLLIIAICGVLFGLFFYWYTSGGDCTTHKAMISTTIILCVFTCVFSAVRGDGSFFVATVVSFYSVFLLFCAIQADPSDTCNDFASDRNTASLWIGYILTFFALFYAALRANQIALLGFYGDNSENDDIEEPLLNEDNEDIGGTNEDNKTEEKEKEKESNYDDYDQEKGKKNKNKNKNKNDDEMEDKPPPKSVQRKENFHFHLIMCLAACYFCMLFTNWGTNSSSVSTSGDIALWINMVCQWVTILLFWWTLAAPLLFPHRFNADDEDE